MKKILGNFTWENWVSLTREVQLLTGGLGGRVELEILKCVDGFGVVTVGKIMVSQQGRAWVCRVLGDLGQT